jgi:carboxymethylenebutenolidase
MSLSLERRTFLTGVAASVGYAVLTQPVNAQAITTDTDGISVGMVQLTASDGAALPAYVAHTNAPGPLPVVLVVQEVFGLHDYIRDICRRLAKAGYFAIAPDLYFRQGDATTITDMKALMAIVSSVDDGQVKNDLDTALAWTLANGGDPNRTAITGFCWGGRQAWLYAEQTPSLKAAAAWYGPLTTAQLPFQPHNPIDQVANLKVPTLGLYGAKDKNIKVDDVEALRTALATSGSGSQIIVYPDAGHGFHADYRPTYNQKDAEDGWVKMLAWFKAHGVA